MRWDNWWHCILLLVTLGLATGVCAAPDIQVNAILGKKIIVTVEGEQHTLKEGDTLEQDLVLQEVHSQYVVFSWQGQSLRLEPSSRISTQFAERSDKVITIYQDASSHYLVSGEINGHSVEFVVDTGATVVSLNAALANQIGLQWQGAPQMAALTAGGTVVTYAVYLDSVLIQGVLLKAVEAVVIPQQDTPALLGMSFLRHFELTQAGNMLTLKKKF